MPHDRKRALLNAALGAAAYGWRVFPLRPGTKRPALHGETTCPGTGACANGHAKWEDRATINPARIRAAWSTGLFNVGLATGPSGLVVVDLDMPKPTDPKGTPDGATSLEALCERAGQAVPTTYRVRTASGGHHLYFTAPDRIRLPSSKGKLASKIDTRAWGGYVVAPGSTVNGHGYEVIDPAPVAALPSWLLDALKPAECPAEPLRLSVPKRGNRAAETALERETALVAGTSEGGREAQLFESARKVARFVGWGDLTRYEVEEAFQRAGEAAGLPASQCRSTLRSVMTWSLANCRPRETV
ncbi:MULTISPECIES: bifunctional DNA primase/polymerase [unclassified Streptomyces]|uniref:bifunctional DNA primase/polymerase n=1 Tax=unclassified Streptomyces TaxID=2593676 RepID=UPI00081B55A5|nr:MULTISPECIES: bifunctional DNA primase/polymerase [unclassified Streptomyces]MYQ85862.1 DNA primase [Streptomyces sp. SID4936]SCE13125.1 Bifunctional DNA primase/polymerase, N-terminal [Streptomyces sp. DvalAA-43]